MEILFILLIVAACFGFGWLLTKKDADFTAAPPPVPTPDLSPEYMSSVTEAGRQMFEVKTAEEVREVFAPATESAPEAPAKKPRAARKKKEEVQAPWPFPVGGPPKGATTGQEKLKPAARVKKPTPVKSTGEALLPPPIKKPRAPRKPKAPKAE